MGGQENRHLVRKCSKLYLSLSFGPLGSKNLGKITVAPNLAIRFTELITAFIYTLAED
jgi:hypothetical protein